MAEAECAVVSYSKTVNFRNGSNSGASAMSAIAAAPVNFQAKDSLHRRAQTVSTGIGSMRDHDTKLRWLFHRGLDLGFPIGEAGRLSVEVAAVMPLIVVQS
jgi:hypothetical protein